MIPSDVPDGLGIAAADDNIRLAPVHSPGRRVIDIDGLPAIESVAGHVVSDLDVQRARDADQR